MPKFKAEDLAKIRDKARQAMLLREGGGRAKVTIHMGTCGIASGAKEVMSALLKEVKKNKVKDVIVTSSGCAGLCSREPMATVEIKGKPPVKYADLTPDKIKVIFKSHVLEGKIVTRYALALGSERMY